MRQYRLQTVKEVDKIFCNKCGREIKMTNGRAEEGVFSVNHTWGYFSNKDGEQHCFDLCESCYDEILATFQISVEIED